MNHLTYLEFLILDPAQGQKDPAVRRKDRLNHTKHVGEKLLTLLPKPNTLPCVLEGGHVTYRVNPMVRLMIGGQRMLHVITYNTKWKHFSLNNMYHSEGTH